MNNTKFRTDIARIIAKDKEKLNVVVRKLCLELDKSMVLKSPVDTGRFKANWNVSFSLPDLSTSESTDKSGGATIAKAQSELQNVKAGTKVYITNSLPYSYRLEYQGWSQQAPMGMVRVTLAEFDSTFKRVGLEVKSL